MLSMTQTLTFRQRLEVENPFSTIFKKAEVLLNNSDYQEALEFVGRRKNMDKYFSMMDFVFCELFTEYREGCFLYYKNKGKQLRHILSKKQIKYYDQAICIALMLAYQNLQQERMISWGHFRSEFMELCDTA